MNTQNRSQAKKQPPITSHPLFPAIVALWFGALFGLGSLAVRPSLIESFVIGSHIDVLVPMAAPPLGITSRILLALFMAALGVAAGAIIARRITRSKPVERQRRRSAANVTAKDKPSPYKAPDEDPYGLIQAEAEQQVAPSSRRRSLAVEPEVQDPYQHNEAPLPGGSPAILDITQFDLDTPPPAQADPLVDDALELDSFPAPETAHAEPLSAETDEQPAEQQPDCLMLDEPAELPEAAAAGAFSQPQVFSQPVQVFKTTEPSSETAMQPPLAEPGFDLVPQQSRPFDAAPPAHEAATPLETAAAAPEPEVMPASVEAEAPLIDLRRFAGPAADLPVEPVSQPEAPIAQAVTETAAPSAKPLDSAAERIASANLAELSPLELIERFAQALQAKRHSGAFPQSLVAAAEAIVAPATEAIAAPAAEANAEPAAQPAPMPAPPAVPVAIDEAADAPAESLAAPLNMPAGMRPLDFSDYDEQDDQPSYVPARAIYLPATDAEPAQPPVAEAAPSEEEVIETEVDVAEEGYSSLLDLARPVPLRQTFVRIDEPAENFVSTEPVVIFPGQDAPLGTRFARPAEAAAPAAQSAQTPTEPEAPASDAAVSPLRRFDVPTAAPAANTQADPAEAERALRSALATLQRMSGAA